MFCLPEPCACPAFPIVVRESLLCVRPWVRPWQERRQWEHCHDISEDTAGGATLDPALHPQFHPSLSQRELPVPIYVTRGEAQRLDNAAALLGEPREAGPTRVSYAGGRGQCLSARLTPPVTLYDCTVGHPDCSHCQGANGSLGCVWCGGRQPACRYGPLCPQGAEEHLCPAPSIDEVSTTTLEPATALP